MQEETAQLVEDLFVKNSIYGQNRANCHSKYGICQEIQPFPPGDDGLSEYSSQVGDGSTRLFSVRTEILISTLPVLVTSSSWYLHQKARKSQHKFSEQTCLQ